MRYTEVKFSVNQFSKNEKVITTVDGRNWISIIKSSLDSESIFGWCGAWDHHWEILVNIGGTH